MTRYRSISGFARTLIHVVLVPGIVLTALAARAAPAIELVAEIPMPAVRGRIDHLAFDAKGNRLFVAALGNNTVEVIDVGAKRVRKSLSGFGEPQGVLYLAGLDRLYVANGSADCVDVLDGTSFRARKRLGAMGDADNVRYDEKSRRVYVGYGKGALKAIDIASEEAVADIPLSGHPESFQLERSGLRIFVNVPDAKQVAVVDRQKNAVIATWQTPGATRNYPMALDETSHRLFVGARRPAVMLVYDTSSGNVVAELPIGDDADDIFFDEARKLVYVICGEGRVDVFHQETADRYVLLESVKTAPGARTGLFTGGGRLYVAASARWSAARILVYEIR